MLNEFVWHRIPRMVAHSIFYNLFHISRDVGVVASVWQSYDGFRWPLESSDVYVIEDDD